MSSDNYNLLNEIDEYVEKKNEIYESIKMNELKNIIDTNIDRSDLSPDETVDYMERVENLTKFINSQFNNNIEIGSYLDKEINKLNEKLNEKESELNELKNKNNKVLSAKLANEKLMSNEYNNILVNKIINHLLKIVIGGLVIMILLCLLKNNGILSGFFVLLLNIIIILGIIYYIFKTIYSKYPRDGDNFYKFKFRYNKE